MIVQPIRPDIEPSIDATREMRDFAWAKIEEYAKQYGHPPHSIAFVLLGDPSDGEQETVAYSWCPVNERTGRLSACATASAVLWKHGLGL